MYKKKEIIVLIFEFREEKTARGGAFPADLCTARPRREVTGAAEESVWFTLEGPYANGPLTKAERDHFDLCASLNQHQTRFTQRSPKSSDRRIPKTRGFHDSRALPRG